MNTFKKPAFVEILAFLVMTSMGCAQNALFFNETTKFAFTAEYKPDSSQPISSSLGYKRRIVAVVPPKEPVSQENANNPQAIPNGEALSLVSTFDVEAQANLGVTIKNYFASGRAATKMTSQPDAAAAASIRALFAPPTLREVSDELQARRLAMALKLKKLNEQQAQAVLVAAGFPVDPGKTATDSLQDRILHALDDVAITKLESAFGRLP